MQIHPFLVGGGGIHPYYYFLEHRVGITSIVV